MTTTLHFLPETRSQETGKLDARRLAKVFGLSMKELSQVLGREQSGVGKHPTSQSLQEPLEELEILGLQLQNVFGDLGTGRMWMRAPNPVLAGEAPIIYLLGQQPQAVARLLQMAETGMPT